jgi:probable rRNA maturation factor
MGLLGLGAHELSVVIVGDAEIRALNCEFRNQDRPTDVLSFSQLETKSGRWRKGRLPAQMKPGDAIPGRGRPLGDVVISIETARKQSQELGLAPRSRLRTLLIHGILHLLGYDHERSRSDAKTMFAKESALATELRRRGFRSGRSSLKTRK